MGSENLPGSSRNNDPVATGRNSDSRKNEDEEVLPSFFIDLFLRSITDDDFHYVYSDNNKAQLRSLRRDLLKALKQRCIEETKYECDFAGILLDLPRAIKRYCRDDEGYWFHKKIENNYNEVLSLDNDMTGFFFMDDAAKPRLAEKNKLDKINIFEGNEDERPEETKVIIKVY